MIQQFNIEFVNKRCTSCNIFWCLEKERDHDWVCPRCGRKQIREWSEETARLENVIRGLRSALKQKTKTKKV